ncbi:MAG: prepilin-type N-terminal cleavage/methylation domain-containing protein [Planctomycetota bacterium]|nr:prepilin-type N-terminal cleavage/methylation domain-containing protein [Planctomycetota bacterium]
MSHAPVRLDAGGVRQLARGFTLVEVLCALAIVATISVVSFRLILEASDQYTDTVVRAEASSRMGSALERVATQLREIPVRSGSSPVAPNITAMTETSLSYVDANGTTQSLGLSGTTLTWNDGAGAKELLRDVTALSLRAYDESNAILPASPSAAQRDLVRRIQITMTTTRQGVVETLRTRVFLRALAAGSGS